MRQFNIFRGTKGWLWLYERQLRLACMHNQKEAERRLRILIFWEKYGDEATFEAFKTKRRTLYRWQESLRKEEGKLSGLDKKSTAPQRRRKRTLPLGLETQIIDLRRDHPRTGKKKVAALCHISESKAGRIIFDLKKRGVLPKHTKVSLYAQTGRVFERKRRPIKRVRRPKQKRGLEIDTVVRFVANTKRYIYTAINLEDRFAFAGTYANHSSSSAKDFLEKLIEVVPFQIREIQTDNGSEFAHHFHDACLVLKIHHYHTYPRCPKMNGTVERFNRTLSEDFIRHHLLLLRDDILQFNEALMDWLIWYNTKRPHQSLGMLSPLQYYVRTLTAAECQMYWTRTRGGQKKR
jgi:transposase InsO family protein